METPRLRRTQLMTALLLLLLCLSLTAATYAWFTFDPYTNVTPMEGRIASGDTNLLISESENGPFDRQCTLNPTHLAPALYPVSTQTLDAFYSAIRQNRDGIITNYSDVTKTPEERLIHGTVFLRCVGKPCDVFFDETTLNFGTDPQVLAAGRLGLKITGADGNAKVLLFKLDDMGNVDGADSQVTVPTDTAVVVGSINTAGEPSYEDDPALSIGRYFHGNANADPLLSMQTDETARVEYWLYLEGCDPECVNSVQSKDMFLQLGYAGNQITE